MSTKASTRYAREAQHASVATAVRRGESWTSDDLNRLSALRNLPMREAAVFMGRTFYAVQTAYRNLEHGQTARRERSAPATAATYRGFREGDDDPYA